MDHTTPHYLLSSHVDSTQGTGRWRFALRSPDGEAQFQAEDVEPEIQGERLDLLTVVRALESLDQPSQVTLVDCSDYVWKGMRYGLPEWRTNGYRWEFFGQMVAVKNADLWQRLDRALRFHDVDCRRRRFDPPHPPAMEQSHHPIEEKKAWGLSETLTEWVKCAASTGPPNVGIPGRRG